MKCWQHASVATSSALRLCRQHRASQSVAAFPHKRLLMLCTECTCVLTVPFADLSCASSSPLQSVYACRCTVVRAMNNIELCPQACRPLPRNVKVVHWGESVSTTRKVHRERVRRGKAGAGREGGHLSPGFPPATLRRERKSIVFHLPARPPAVNDKS